MSALRARAEEYLAMRRALGFKLTTQGRHLMSFVRFCEDRCADRVTADLAVEWATRTMRGSGNEVYQARRLDVVRIFARHLQALDPVTELPALKRGNAGLERDIYDPPERQPAGELVRLAPGLPCGRARQALPPGQLRPAFRAAAHGPPLPTWGRVITAVSCLIGNALACLLDMPERSQALIECRVTALPAPSRRCR
jgi:hypothetical protein